VPAGRRSASPGAGDGVAFKAGRWIARGPEDSLLYALPYECEVCHVLQGMIKVQVEDRTFELELADTLALSAAVPHARRATDGAQILRILAPGLPGPQRDKR